jgi:hypothetical protein
MKTDFERAAVQLTIPRTKELYLQMYGESEELKKALRWNDYIRDFDLDMLFGTRLHGYVRDWVEYSKSLDDQDPAVVWEASQTATLGVYQVQEPNYIFLAKLFIEKVPRKLQYKLLKDLLKLFKKNAQFLYGANQGFCRAIILLEEQRPYKNLHPEFWNRLRSTLLGYLYSCSVGSIHKNFTGTSSPFWFGFNDFDAFYIPRIEALGLSFRFLDFGGYIRLCRSKPYMEYNLRWFRFLRFLEKVCLINK